MKRPSDDEPDHGPSRPWSMEETIAITDRLRAQTVLEVVKASRGALHAAEALNLLGCQILAEAVDLGSLLSNKPPTSVMPLLLRLIPQIIGLAEEAQAKRAET